MNTRNTELFHYGVKGMKWGVRRYQRKDGTLTSAGKKKYRDERGFLTDAGHKQRDANDRKLYEGSRQVLRKIEKGKEYKQASSDLQESRKINRKSYAQARDDYLTGREK